MTVIEFGKRDLKLNTLIIVLVAVLIFSAIGSIVAYNHLISLRHDVKNNENMLAKMQVENAELKNKVDKMIGSASDPLFIQSSGLIIEKTPVYATPSAVISRVSL